MKAYQIFIKLNSGSAPPQREVVGFVVLKESVAREAELQNDLFEHEIPHAGPHFALHPCFERDDAKTTRDDLVTCLAGFELVNRAYGSLATTITAIANARARG